MGNIKYKLKRAPLEDLKKKNSFFYALKRNKRLK